MEKKNKKEKTNRKNCYRMRLKISLNHTKNNNNNNWIHARLHLSFGATTSNYTNFRKEI